MTSSPSFSPFPSVQSRRAFLSRLGGGLGGAALAQLLGAEHLAARLEAEANTVEAQLQRAFELTLGRAATAGELADFTAHARLHGLANCCRLLFNSNEFLFVP